MSCKHAHLSPHGKWEHAHRATLRLCLDCGALVTDRHCLETLRRGVQARTYTVRVGEKKVVD